MCKALAIAPERNADAAVGPTGCPFGREVVVGDRRFGQVVVVRGHRVENTLPRDKTWPPATTPRRMRGLLLPSLRHQRLAETACIATERVCTRSAGKMGAR